ncbi:hypothetical protein M404DRAFT_11489, partial [Pisolithus tinctorius Marx 270]
MTLALENVPKEAYPSISDPAFRIACYASEISLQVYFDDVKQFVFSKVSEELNDLLGSNDNIIRHAARDRFMALARWKDEPCPLSYNQGVLSNLLLAITPSDAGKFDLTTSVLGQRPVTFFVETIITQCARDGHRKPPFIHTGNFFHVANVAIDEIKAIARRAGIPPLHEHRFMVDAFCCACEALKINHVPWSPNPANRAGRPSTTVVHDVWLNLGAKALSSTMNSSTLSRSNSALLMAQQASVQIQSSDPRGDWSAIDVQLTAFDSVLHKVNLPSEWDLSHIAGGSSPPYILEAYHFVRNTYDGTKPLHRLAMISAIVCCGLLPKIFPPSLDRYPSNRSEYQHYVQDLDWVTRTGRKGINDPQPFITMVSAFVINLYEASSPISQRMRSRADLRPWFAKHTAIIQQCTLPAAKGINSMLLVRLGLATVETASGFRSAKWNIDIRPLPMTIIEEKHAEVVRLLKTGGKYGGFDAVRYLVGARAADVLNDHHYVLGRPLPSSLRLASSSKRTHQECDSGDEGGQGIHASSGSGRKFSRPYGPVWICVCFAFTSHSPNTTIMDAESATASTMSIDARTTRRHAIANMPTMDPPPDLANLIQSDVIEYLYDADDDDDRPTVVRYEIGNTVSIHPNNVLSGPCPRVR